MVVFFSIVPISIGVTEILELLSTGLRCVGAARSIYYPGRLSRHSEPAR